MARTINLTDRDIDYISRVVDTEVPRSIQRRDPAVYRDMVRAVVDTVTNRLASEGYPKSVTGVLNQRRQFSKITGPSSLDPYGSVQNTPVASQVTQDLVREHIGNRVAGGEPIIGDAVNYANPNFSSKSNLSGWINPMIEAGAKKLGLGNAIHWHGNAPGAVPPDEYGVALNGVDNTEALSRVPTPTFADRAGTGLNQADSATGIMAAVNPATAMSVERGLLSDPSMSLSGSAAGGISQGGAATGLLSSFRDPQAEMAALQQEANQSRQRLEMQNGSLSLSPDQLSSAMDRRRSAMGLLSVDQDPVAAIEAASPLQAAAQATPQSLASAYGQLGQSMQQGGILGLSGQKIMDPNDVLGVGKLQTQPGLAVESMPEIDITQVSEIPSIAGPATAEVINTPQQTAKRANQTVTGGLLSPAEYDALSNQQMALADMGVNKAAKMKAGLKNGVGALGGGILGSMLAGPLGALAGGLLGPALMNGMAFGPKTGEGYFPSAPKESPYGNGKETSYGRSVRESSGQYDHATRTGSHGLY